MISDRRAPGTPGFAGITQPVVATGQPLYLEDALALLMCLLCPFNINEEGLRYLRQWVNEPAFAGAWMMTTFANWSRQRPGALTCSLV